MSVPDKSIDPRLLQSAKEVFLDKGFEMAQLSEICKKAGVTTGALYKRFAGKEELFCAIVKDTIEAMEEYVDRIETADLSRYTDQQIYEGFHMDSETNINWFKYLYEHKEGFTLLIKCSSGTRYGDFHDKWPERMARVHYKFYLEAKRRGMATKEVTEEEINVLTSSVWAMFYKPFFLGFSWESMEKIAYALSEFVNWYAVLGIEK